MKTTLTIEESDRLIELGVDAKLASYRTIGALIPTDEPNLYRKVGKNERAFTLTDILSILPKEIEVESRYEPLSIYWDNRRKGWSAYYPFAHTPKIVEPELIDALNSLLIWAIENKHIT